MKIVELNEHMNLSHSQCNNSFHSISDKGIIWLAFHKLFDNVFILDPVV